MIKKLEESEAEEKRIYVIVPETIQVYIPTTSTKRLVFRDIVQSCGRNSAQVGHVVSKMRVLMDRREKPNPDNALVDSYTTIVLGARDTKELKHIVHLLSNNSISHYTFFDHNTHVYGTVEPQLTAICTEPIEQIQVIGILDYLPLWEHSKDHAHIHRD
jgi:hypothetical protein